MMSISMRKSNVLKLVLLIFYLFLGLSTMVSQEKTRLKVQGRAVHIDPKPVFKATVAISNVNEYYSNQPASINDITERYIKRLKEKGIPWSMFTQKPHEFGYETLKTGRRGTLYEFRTSSANQMRNFLEVGISGVETLRSVALVELSNEEARELYKKALDAAYQKAQLIAQAMEKKVGDIIEVTDNRLEDNFIENYIYYDRAVGEYIYNLQVIYSVK